MSAPVREKDPAQVASGLRGARKRWGIRTVRLADLDPGVAEVIRLMVAADEEARAKRAKEAAARVAEQAPDAPETAA